MKSQIKGTLTVMENYLNGLGIKTVRNRMKTMINEIRKILDQK